MLYRNIIFRPARIHVIDLKRACLLVANFIEGINTSEMKFRAFSAIERFHFVALTGPPATRPTHECESHTRRSRPPATA